MSPTIVVTNVAAPAAGRPAAVAIHARIPADRHAMADAGIVDRSVACLPCLCPALGVEVVAANGIGVIFTAIHPIVGIPATTMAITRAEATPAADAPVAAAAQPAVDVQVAAAAITATV
jgi:hypothetical protein